MGSVAVSVVPDVSRFNAILKEKLRDLTSNIKLDVDVAAAKQKIAQVTQASSKKITVDFDDAGAKAKIKDLQSSLTDKNLAIRVTTDEARAKLAELSAAISATKAEIKVSEDDTEAKARLEALKAEMQQVRAKLELDTAPAKAQAAEVQAEISRLKAQLKVDLDKATAEAELAALTRPESKTINVNADTGAADAKLASLGASSSGASGGMISLVQAAIGLSPALVAVGASAIGAAAALGTMAAAGGVGFGVMAIALSGVTSAVKLLGQQQTAQAAASQSAANGAAANAQAIVSAQRQIQSAEMSLGDARRQAANAAISASQSVASAQYGLIQADQQEQSALQALQSAREAATRQLTSMANAAVDARLSERQAALDLETATANYSKTMQNAGSTEQQRQQAALDLAKAQQHLTEAHQAATNAQVDNAKAQKAGVDGAPQVVSASQAVANAHHQQQQAAQTLANAQRAQAQQQIQSSESIQRAQQGVTAAMDAMAAAQRQSAGSTSASLAAINAKVAALDPTTRKFAEYLRGTWAPIWKQVQAASAGGFLPGLHDGMEAMRSSMPGLISFIKDISSRLGDMARNVGAAFNSPFWQSFFAFLQRTIGPVLSALGTILGNIATGFAGLWMAFEPIIMPITKGIEGLTGKFADFGKQAAGSEGFGKFIAFMRATGPVVMKILGDLWQIIVHVVQALAPLAGPMLAGLSTLTGILKQIPVPVLTAAAVAIGAIYSGMKLVQGISALASLGPWGLAALAVAGAFILVYTNSKTFRDFIANQVIPTLKAWGDWLMTHVVPALSALWDWITHKLVPVMAGIFMDAWKGITWAIGVVSKAFSDNKGEMKQVWDMFSGFVGFIVKYVLPLLGTYLKFEFEVLGKAIGVVINIIGALVDAWNIMWAQGKALGHWFANDFVNFFKGAWHTIQDGFTSLVAGINKLWNNLKHYLMDPVAFMVDVVINKGLIAAWDWVVSHLHLPGSWHAAPMGVPKVPPLMATGGVLPGYAPGQDTVHAILSPGEGVLVPEATRALGGAAGINAINSQFSSRVPGPGMTGGFAGGGVLGSIGGFLSGAASKVGSFLTGTAGWITDPIGQMKSVVVSALGGLSGAAPMYGLLKDMVGSLAGGAGQAIKDGIGGALSALGGNFGASTPASSAPSSQAANVAIVKSWASPYGWQSGAEWDALVSVINRESGFRNTAQNPTSSAYGMFQFLDSTWAGLGFSKTSDPVRQAMAGMKYISGRYGDPLGALRHEQAFGWYDQGGLLPTGPSLVYNGTGSPELIAPRHTFEQIMAGATGGGAGPVNINARVFIGDREITDIARVEAEHVMGTALGVATSRGAYNG